MSKAKYGWLLPVIFVLLTSATCFAAGEETKDVIAEGTYIMGDSETPSIARERAIADARRIAVEQAGIYLESYSQTQNLQLTKDEVNVISSGIVETTIMDQKTELLDGGVIRFYCKISCVVRLDSVEEMRNRLREKGGGVTIEQYNSLVAQNAALQQQLHDLKQQLDQAASDEEKKAIIQGISDNEKKFKIQALLQEANDDYVDNRYDDVVRAADQILAMEANADAYFWRGLIYDNRKQYEAAISDYTKAINLKADSSAYCNRGIIYYNQGRYDEAIADYTQALKIKPDDSKYYYDRGLAYDEQELYDSAIDDYSQAIKLDSSDADSYYCRGLVYYKKNMYVEAIDDYTRAIGLSPDNADAYFNRGLAYHAEGLKNESIADFKEACKIKPAYYDALPEDIKDAVAAK